MKNIQTVGLIHESATNNDEEKQRMHDNRRRKDGASSLKIALENSIANIKDAIKIPDSSAQDDDFDVIDISQKK